ncbi:hypothetical protein [Pseudoalteromonas aurantia]|uniref:Uncharacterized protein n=1 Tax=Pseudoalteromonas aurantia TaxID=43654 RepID=A0A5S3V6V7_9GAMM|nr:hypothetical protein [Pseudoalteromonas aurantia]TMO67426.1 hypothetical protein CWC19_13810 [Pseudoalteromonas aurantia]
MTHTPITLRKPLNDSPAVKALPTITEKGGLLYLQFHGAELSYDKKTPILISGSSTAAKHDFNVYKVTSGQFQGRFLKRPHLAASAEPFDSHEWVVDSVGLKFRDNGSYSYIFYDTYLDWGDDQIIPIISGENVKTDLNGNTVKVFCHHTQIPIGIAHHG